jgi:uncharacterized membrane protein
MTWRGSTDVKDRLFSIFVYILPLASAFPFGASLVQQFPFLNFLAIPMLPLGLIYSAVPFGLGGLLIFFALYAGVVRNTNINHFLRFNVMQAILIDILLMLINLIVNILSPSLGGSLLLTTLNNVIFLGTLAVCVYGMIQSGLGKYAEIPTISEAAYSQVP